MPGPYYHPFDPDPKSDGTVCKCGKGKNHPIHS